MSNNTAAKTPIDVGDGAAIPVKSDKGLFTAWRIAFLGAIATLTWLAVTKPDPYLTIIKFVPDGIVVKKGNKELVDLLNKGIAAVKKKKLDAKIHAQWVK